MTGMVFAILAVLIAWTMVFLAIRRWGPGQIRRSLLCPEKEIPAGVTFLRQEGSFGSLRVADVTKCSLFPGTPVTCDKHCMG